MNKTVVVVDDFNSTRKVITAMLEPLGITVLKASNGYDAKEYFKGRTFDLLITDLNMPYMSGADLTKFVRNTGQYQRLPILLLTTEIKKEKKDAALEAGVTTILQKPYDSKEFMTLVKRLLSI